MQFPKILRVHKQEEIRCDIDLFDRRVKKGAVDGGNFFAVEGRRDVDHVAVVERIHDDVFAPFVEGVHQRAIFIQGAHALSHKAVHNVPVKINRRNHDEQRDQNAVCGREGGSLSKRIEPAEQQEKFDRLQKQEDQHGDQGHRLILCVHKG